MYFFKIATVVENVLPDLFCAFRYDHTMTKNRTMNTIARMGVDHIFMTKNKVGSADSK